MKIELDKKDYWYILALFAIGIILLGISYLLGENAIVTLYATAGFLVGVPIFIYGYVHLQ